MSEKILIIGKTSKIAKEFIKKLSDSEKLKEFSEDDELKSRFNQI